MKTPVIYIEALSGEIVSGFFRLFAVSFVYDGGPSS
jgi:hypothetical protein